MRFFYYVTGPMGVGKSTCIAHLYNISSYDEWTQERLPELGKDRNSLNENEEKEIEKWLDEEFHRKNWDLSQVRYGMYMIDRPPLDPLAFTDETKWGGRASRLIKAIIKNAVGREIVGGHIFLLLGDPKELFARITAQNKHSSIKTITQNQEFLKKIYKVPGVTIIDTRSMGVAEVTRFIATAIHLDEYDPANIHRQMVKIAAKNEVQGELRLEEEFVDGEDGL